MNNKSIVIPLHFILLFLVYLLLLQFNVITVIPNDENLLAWDADWYNSIKNSGYIYVPDHACNMAFFPLFPVLWKLSFVEGIGISLINLLIFIVSFYWLMKGTAASQMDLLLLLSLPGLIFCFLPYSEALFFLFGVMLIRGFDSRSKLLICIGLMGCCLTRSASAIFVPALIIKMVFDLYAAEKEKKKPIIRDTCIYCFICIFCLLLVAFIQYRQTGLWFHFLQVQKYWNRRWIIPGIPFTTYLPERVLKYDASALLLGIVSIYFCVKFTTTRAKDIPGSILFSLLCIAGVTVLDVFFTRNMNGHANIWSLNRHLLCTPFIAWLLIWFWKRYQHGPSDLYIISGLTFICLFLSGVYSYLFPAVYFISFAAMFLLVKFSPELSRYRLLLYVFNLVSQALLLADFLNGQWVA